MDKHLFIRSDATSYIGTGHIMRCIVLAQAWRDRGGIVTFLSRCENSAIRQRIESAGIAFIPLEKPHPDPGDLQRTCEILKQFKIKNPKFRSNDRSTTSYQPSAVTPWVTLDGYHFDPAYQSALRGAGCKVLVIDDMAHQPEYHADILLNQNIYAQNLKYNCSPDTLRLLGTQYVLLRKEFLKKKGSQREIPETARHILVTLGGADSENVTMTVVRALKRLERTDVEVKIVVGEVNQNRQSIEKELRCSPFDFQILSCVTDMPTLMAWADMAVSAGGSTCWELIFMGVPFLVVILSENQEGIANGLGEAGAAINCGWHYALTADRLAEILVELINDRECRRALNGKGQQMVDGLGTERAIERMRRHL